MEIEGITKGREEAERLATNILDAECMQQAHVFISGVVQGVGFRYFIRSLARKSGVTGWTRNSEDGGVEAVFQGEKQNVEELIELCRKGPMLSEIEQIGYEWEKSTEVYDDFVIKKE